MCFGAANFEFGSANCGWAASTSIMCDESEKLFVLHCHTDDSHVVVDDSSVIYGESVKVGDEIQFSFPGSKGLLVGTVKGIKG